MFLLELSAFVRDQGGHYQHQKEIEEGGHVDGAIEL
jgi:hypothetical protein